MKRSSYLGGENGNTSSHINSQNKQDIIEGLFTVFNNKVIGSTTFDSKKSKSNIKYISFEEFRNLNCHEKISDIKDDKSLSGIMRSYHDFDINDLDILKDIYIQRIYLIKFNKILEIKTKNESPNTGLSYKILINSV